MALIWYYYADKTQKDKVSHAPSLPSPPKKHRNIHHYQNNTYCSNNQYHEMLLDSLHNLCLATVQSNLVSSNFVTFCLCWRSVTKMYAMHHLEGWKSRKNVNFPKNVTSLSSCRCSLVFSHTRGALLLSWGSAAFCFGGRFYLQCVKRIIQVPGSDHYP